MDAYTLENNYKALLAGNIQAAMEALFGWENLGGAFIGGSYRFLDSQKVPDSSDLDVFVWVYDFNKAEEALRDGGFEAETLAALYSDNAARFVMRRPNSRDTLIDMHVFEAHHAFSKLKKQHDSVEMWSKSSPEGIAFIHFMTELALAGKKPKGTGKYFFRYMLSRAEGVIK